MSDSTAYLLAELGRLQAENTRLRDRERRAKARAELRKARAVSVSRRVSLVCGRCACVVTGVPRKHAAATTRYGVAVPPDLTLELRTERRGEICPDQPRRSGRE